MDDQSKRFPFPMVGDADPIPASLFVAYPEQATTLALLYEVSRELTSILDREELLRRVAQRVKKLVNYHVFSVMLWNEKTQRLEGVFAIPLVKADKTGRQCQILLFMAWDACLVVNPASKTGLMQVMSQT
jgi:nitrate/nitrite-specific signal transduction histidine kinase